MMNGTNGTRYRVLFGNSMHGHFIMIVGVPASDTKVSAVMSTDIPQKERPNNASHEFKVVVNLDLERMNTWQAELALIEAYLPDIIKEVVTILEKEGEL